MVSPERREEAIVINDALAQELIATKRKLAFPLSIVAEAVNEKWSRAH
jgi:hypothetical protein